MMMMMMMMRASGHWQCCADWFYSGGRVTLRDNSLWTLETFLLNFISSWWLYVVTLLFFLLLHCIVCIEHCLFLRCILSYDEHWFLDVVVVSTLAVFGNIMRTLDICNELIRSGYTSHDTELRFVLHVNSFLHWLFIFLYYNIKAIWSCQSSQYSVAISLTNRNIWGLVRDKPVRRPGKITPSVCRNNFDFAPKTEYWLIQCIIAIILLFVWIAVNNNYLCDFYSRTILFIFVLDTVRLSIMAEAAIGSDTDVNDTLL